MPLQLPVHDIDEDPQQPRQQFDPHKLRQLADSIERRGVLRSEGGAPIAELSALYREARFSEHELGEEHRERAEAALRALHQDLARILHTAPVGAPGST